MSTPQKSSMIAHFVRAHLIPAWAGLWPQAAALAGWGGALLALASRKFRKRLD